MPWVKGQSGNPAGRPKMASQLARLARSKTQDGLELVEFAVAVMRGEVVGAPGAQGDEPERPSVHDRMDALKWLADRGWGKAVEHIEIEDSRTGEQSPATIAPELLEDGLGPEGMVQ